MTETEHNDLLIKTSMRTANAIVAFVSTTLATAVLVDARRRANCKDGAAMMMNLEPLESRRLLAATSWRINAGGDGLVESSGKTWQADRQFTGGAVSGNRGDRNT